MTGAMPKRHESIADYLGRKLEGFAAKTRFARATRTSKTIVSQWTKGDAVPNFSNCLKIAAYFDEDPTEIFGLAGRPEFLEEWERLMRLSRDALDPMAVVNEHHRELHRKVQRILDSGREVAAILDYNICAIYDRAIETGAIREKEKDHRK